jgi:hypothetical protein
MLRFACFPWDVDGLSNKDLLHRFTCFTLDADGLTTLDICSAYLLSLGGRRPNNQGLLHLYICSPLPLFPVNS